MFEVWTILWQRSNFCGLNFHLVLVLCSCIPRLTERDVISARPPSFFIFSPARLALFRCVAWRVVSFHSISSRFVSCCVVSCRAVPCRFVLFRFVPCRVVSGRYVPFRYVPFRFGSFRFFCLLSRMALCRRQRTTLASGWAIVRNYTVGSFCKRSIVLQQYIYIYCIVIWRFVVGNRYLRITSDDSFGYGLRRRLTCKDDTVRRRPVFLDASGPLLALSYYF